MANHRIVSDDMAHRRDDSFHQTELSGGRYLSFDLPPPSEYDGDSDSRSLFWDGVPGIEDEVEGVSSACDGTYKAIVRDTGFSLLRP